MVLQIIKDQLGVSTLDSISVSTLFLVAIIAIQAMKLMAVSAKQRESQFKHSPELKAARQEFNNRQRAQRDSTPFHSRKANGGKFKEPKQRPDSFYTLGMSRAAKANYYANKAAKEKKQAFNSKLQKARVSRGFSAVKDTSVSRKSASSIYKSRHLG